MDWLIDWGRQGEVAWGLREVRGLGAVRHRRLSDVVISDLRAERLERIKSRKAST